MNKATGVDKGGQVYPIQGYVNGRGLDSPPREGISRRDWLAGMASQGVLTVLMDLSKHFPGALDQKSMMQSDIGRVVANLSYDIADALIAKSRE